jgi:hypothetical protein
MVTELIKRVPDGALMPTEVAELSEYVLTLVANDPAVMRFAEEFCARLANTTWKPGDVINFLLLQATVINL